MVRSVLQFGWKREQAVIVSVISIANSDSNLFAITEFLILNMKMRIFCLGRYATSLKKMEQLPAKKVFLCVSGVESHPMMKWMVDVHGLMSLGL